MNKKVLFFSALTLTITSLLCLFLFRFTPNTKIWENYTVLYVEKNLSVETIIDLLESNDIYNVISQNHENYPVPSQFAPVQFHKFSTEITYENLQNVYFSDKNDDFNLFYIPNEFSANISKCFENIDAIWGIDSNGTTTYIPFTITTIFYLLLIIFAKNKLVFLGTQLPFVLLSLVVPLYHIAVLVCALLFSYFLIERFRNRIGYTKKLIKNYNFYAFICITLIIMILLGIKAVIIFLFSSTASFSIDSLFRLISEEHNKRQIFLPIPIHSARTLHIKTKKLQLIIIFTFCSVFLLTTLAYFSPNSGSTNNKNIEIPTPKNTTNDFSEQSYIDTISSEVVNRLPDLTDYISTAWYYETYPYSRISNEVKEVVYPGDTVSTTEYIKLDNTLTEKTKIMAEFNNDYITNIIKTIESLKNSGAEKLLASQKGF